MMQTCFLSRVTVWPSRTTTIARPAVITLLLALLMLFAGCATTPVSAPSPAAMAQQQKRDRAITALTEALKKYDAGSNEEAKNNFLVALDSGQLTLAEQLNARKHMAFIHCLASRAANCKEEFEKVFALDAKFDLTPAEAGHPTWGPVFRLVKTEIELKRNGRALPTNATKQPSKGELLLAEGSKAYDDADYNKALKSLADALKETLGNTDQIKARKLSAFSYCLTNRMTLCKAEFQKIIDLQPDYELEAAEAGHPSWGPSFRAVKPKKFVPATLAQPLK